MKRAWLAAKVEAMLSFGQTNFFPDGINQEREGESYVNSEKTIWLQNSAKIEDKQMSMWKQMKREDKISRYQGEGGGGRGRGGKG